MAKFKVTYKVTMEHEEIIDIDEEYVEEFGGLEQTRDEWDFEDDVNPDWTNQCNGWPEYDVLSVEIVSA